MSTTFQIISKGRVYAFNRRELNFERVMEMLRALLQGRSRDETFDALHQGLAEKWMVRDETVKPFGDKRENVRLVCSFDLDQDILYYSDQTFGYGHIQLPLSRLRDSKIGPVQASEFKPFELPSPPPLHLANFPPPFKKPSMPISDRRFGFTSRVLSDFSDQWRHVLRSYYADPTLRRFARAIISLATYTFQVDEICTSQHISFRSLYVTIVDLPSWEPCGNHIIRISGTTVIIDHDLQSALKFAKEEAKVPRDSGLIEPTANTYLLLSVRHMIVCHVDSKGTFSHTAPASLLDGISPPSPDTIHLLLQALAPASRPPPPTPVHRLPLEIQDRILEQVSEGPIEAARLGCLLELGSPFTWMRFRDPPRRGGAVELFISPCHRYDISPVESKICFGDDFSGVSYR